MFVPGCLALLVTVLAAVHSAQGFAAGAPQQACKDMVPQHKVDPQKTPFPYNLYVSKKAIKSGGKVTFTISTGGKAKNFKGFFVQARLGDEPVGKFEPAPGVKLVNCGNGEATGATHDGAFARENVTLTWVAPPRLTETVRFRTTVAENGGVFWVGQLSKPLLIKKS